MKKTIKDYQKEIRELKAQVEFQKKRKLETYEQNEKLEGEKAELRKEKETILANMRELDHQLTNTENALKESQRNLIYENGVVRGLMSAILCNKGIVPDFHDVEGYKSRFVREKEANEKGVRTVLR